MDINYKFVSFDVIEWNIRVTLAEVIRESINLSPNTLIKLLFNG